MGNNIQILIFAGTTEGRLLAQYASQHEIGCYVSTATEYGKSILEGLKGVECISGRMDRKEMEIFIGEHEIRLVIDATHPFAVEVSENIKAACEKEKVRYVRCLREALGERGTEGGAAEAYGMENMIIVDSVEQAAEYLRGTTGNILIATGSKELSLYTRIEGYEKRCFARVLSTGEAVEESIRLGFRGRHLIAMQGPFSAEMNLALLHQTEARYFVTKESGKAGGFGEKLEAAKAAGAVLVAVARPMEDGESLESVERLMKEAGEKYCQYSEKSGK